MNQRWGRLDTYLKRLREILQDEDLHYRLLALFLAGILWFLPEDMGGCFLMKGRSVFSRKWLACLISLPLWDSRTLSGL